MSTQTFKGTDSGGPVYHWTAPAGVSTVTVQAWGCGANGASHTSPSLGGGAGGGGAYASGTISVTAGHNYDATAYAGNTTLGVSSFVGDSTKVTADYGRAGSALSGGAGGLVANCFGSTKVAGGKGGNSITSGAGGGGGGCGGGSPAGDGTNCHSTSVAGEGGIGGNGGGNGGLGGAVAAFDGTGPGGGGGGAGYSSSSIGHGAYGQIILTWTATASSNLVYMCIAS